MYITAYTIVVNVTGTQLFSEPVSHLWFKVLFLVVSFHRVTAIVGSMRHGKRWAVGLSIEYQAVTDHNCMLRGLTTLRRMSLLGVPVSK